MNNKVYATMDEAVADIPDGSTLMCPGFSGVGVPRNLLAAVNRQGAKGLTCISNNAGTTDELGRRRHPGGSRAGQEGDLRLHRIHASLGRHSLRPNVQRGAGGC